MRNKRIIMMSFFCLLIVAGGVITVINLLPIFRHAATSQQAPPPPPPPPPEPADEEPPPVLQVPEEEIPPEEEDDDDDDGLPVGKLILTRERTVYEDMALTLRIPELDLVCPVYNGTTAEVLSKMAAGLYEYAQLPGKGNRNTSLAGHRNTRRNGVITDKAPFYYVDRLKEGDYLYLSDEDSIYRYLWEFCDVVEADDWSMIRTAGYSCITITSCHPIGISSHRIVIRGRLDEIFPYDDDFLYEAAAPAGSIPEAG